MSFFWTFIWITTFSGQMSKDQNLNLVEGFPRLLTCSWDW